MAPNTHLHVCMTETGGTLMGKLLERHHKEDSLLKWGRATPSIMEQYKKNEIFMY